MSGPHNIHGTGLVLDGFGVLVRGPSGSGKSLLALDLLLTYEQSGRTALLVADDRVDLSADTTALSMAPPPAIAGMIELRGRGIVTRPFAQSAPLHLIVDLVDEFERMPAEEAFTTTLYGIRVARCPVPARGRTDPAHQRLLVAEALRGLAQDRGMGQKTS